jgi:hypothetical protein
MLDNGGRSQQSSSSKSQHRNFLTMEKTIVNKIVTVLARPLSRASLNPQAQVARRQNVILCGFESLCCSGGGRHPIIRRGVAQPGRAPGSGPGGRRFKSSLPDQSFQGHKLRFWFFVSSAVVDFVDGEILRGQQASKLTRPISRHSLGDSRITSGSRTQVG